MEKQLGKSIDLRQSLMSAIEELSDEQLSTLIRLALFLKNQENYYSIVDCQAYQEWVSSENDVYDELFADELKAV